MVGVVQDLLPFPLPSSDAKIHRCSGPSYKIAHLWDDLKYMHPPIYFNSSLDYLQYLIQCKCYVNCCWHVGNSSFAFWNFLEFFFSNIFNPWMVESTDGEPTDTQGRLLFCFLRNSMYRIVNLQKYGKQTVIHYTVRLDPYTGNGILVWNVKIQFYLTFLKA